MQDLEVVEVLEGRQQLSSNTPEDGITQGVAVDEFQEGTPLAELSHHIIVVLVLVHVVQLDDIGVVESLEQVHFIKEVCLILFTHVFLFEYFYGPDILANLLEGLEDLSKRSLPNTVQKRVVVVDRGFLELRELSWVDYDGREEGRSLPGFLNGFCYLPYDFG